MAAVATVVLTAAIFIRIFPLGPPTPVSDKTDTGVSRGGASFSSFLLFDGAEDVSSQISALDTPLSYSYVFDNPESEYALAIRKLTELVVENGPLFAVRFLSREVRDVDSSSLAGAICANKQGRFFDYHHAVMGESALPNRERVLTLAGELGLDKEQLKNCLEEVPDGLLGYDWEPGHLTRAQLIPRFKVIKEGNNEGPGFIYCGGRYHETEIPGALGCLEEIVRQSAQGGDWRKERSCAENLDFPVSRDGDTIAIGNCTYRVGDGALVEGRTNDDGCSTTRSEAVESRRLWFVDGCVYLDGKKLHDHRLNFLAFLAGKGASANTPTSSVSTVIPEWERLVAAGEEVGTTQKSSWPQYFNWFEYERGGFMYLQLAEGIGCGGCYGFGPSLVIDPANRSMTMREIPLPPMFQAVFSEGRTQAVGWYPEEEEGETAGRDYGGKLYWFDFVTGVKRLVFEVPHEETVILVGYHASPMDQESVTWLDEDRIRIRTYRTGLEVGQEGIPEREMAREVTLDLGH